MNIREIKNFRIAKSLYGKGLTISVPTQNFFYNHDEVFDAALESDLDEDRTHTVDRATQYTMRKGIPGFAKDFVFVGGYEEK